ncbi:hypothetical protein [Erythrobacter donghaensis]|jgi:hypothetical protein|uniref:hypothetical protein n=1 Tax=Erythrobacter donghaensis TaxID=267135 RepID=UPI00093D3F0E|nr:hypothetical protein [Erythrobacter donghaensis]
MSVFQSIACLLNQHQPMRREVTWNGRHYIGVCRHCDAPIQRLGRRRWRKRKDAGRGSGEPSST